MNDLNDALSVILACRRLLCQQTWTEEEARTAVAACDEWLTKYNPPQPVTRKQSRLPTEMVIAILRNFRGKDGKTTLLNCRLVNKEWRQLAWTRFWYAVYIKNAQEATNRLLHPSALEVMKGVEIRKLELTSRGITARDVPRGIGILLGGPMMRGIRVLTIPPQISVSQLFVIFRSLPWLVALSIGVDRGRIEWDDLDVREGYEGGKSWGRLWRDEDDATWKSGFGNLKRLSIVLYGGVSAGFDLLDVMSAYLGTQLESLHVTDLGPPTAVDHFFRKVSASRLVHLSLSDCSDDLVRTAAATCVHLKYLHLYDCEHTRETLQHLATGPVLRGFDNFWLGRLRCPMQEDDYESFLKERGSCLEILYLDIPDASDRTLERILAFCPELRELNAGEFQNVTEKGVIAFLNRSPKLKCITLPDHLWKNGAILGVASAKAVKIEWVMIPSYDTMLEECWMGW
ncbi:hypothetical protein HK104_000603 [Borealophlyctis nickersoniae]|nr:hypothetical protein HK104_000603 [Borealophlyctis nickersoniae]